MATAKVIAKKEDSNVILTIYDFEIKRDTLY
jgi:hypothetical protein